MTCVMYMLSIGGSLSVIIRMFTVNTCAITKCLSYSLSTVYLMVLQKRNLYKQIITLPWCTVNNILLSTHFSVVFCCGCVYFRRAAGVPS